jgi:hypothetical protein
MSNNNNFLLPCKKRIKIDRKGNDFVASYIVEENDIKNSLLNIDELKAIEYLQKRTSVFEFILS